MFRKHAIEDGRTGSTGSDYDYGTLVFHQQLLTLYSRNISESNTRNHIIDQRVFCAKRFGRMRSKALWTRSSSASLPYPSLTLFTRPDRWTSVGWRRRQSRLLYLPRRKFPARNLLELFYIVPVA
jgi:hypothetical protein